MLSLACFYPLYEFLVLKLFARLILIQVLFTNLQDICVSWIQIIVLDNFNFQILSLLFNLSLNLLTDLKTFRCFSGKWCGLETQLSLLKFCCSVFLHFFEDFQSCLFFFARLAKLSRMLGLGLFNWIRRLNSLANPVET